MKKKMVFFVLFLLLSTIAYADDSWFLKSLDADISLKISTTLRIFPKAPNFDVNYISANFTFFPKQDYRQQIAEINYWPQPEFKDDERIIFKWYRPEGNNVSFDVGTLVKTKNDRFRMPSKVKFPLTEIPKDVQIYTKPSNFIDSDNKEIIRLASGLAEGEDDLFVVAHKLATWTNENINYSLTTMTADASQTSSWVLENRIGVCDEMTNLFIGMARSLGIPARFVSGISYTNSKLFKQPWGPHGWAEVYFPGYGWVPFDPTYGQYGFVDASHIKLKESLDSKGSSTDYEWLGRDVVIVAEKLNYDTRLVRTGLDDPGYVFITLKSRYNEVAIGSYDLIEADVENLNNFYIAEELFLSKVEDMEILGSYHKNVLLKPFEKKTVFWIVRVNPGLSHGYLYTFPLSITTHTVQEAKSSFKSSGQGSFHDLQEIKNLVTKGPQKVYSPDIEIDCSPDKSSYYIEQQPVLGCRLKNTGNKQLDSLKVCAGKYCQTTSLGLNQEAKLLFALDALQLGPNYIKITTANNDVSKSASAWVLVEDRPSLDIEDLKYPEAVDYDAGFNISFNLVRNSSSFPQNATVYANYKDQVLVYQLREFTGSRPVQLQFPEADFLKRDNPMKLRLVYYDKEGKQYAHEQDFNVKIANINPWIMLKIFWRQIFG